MANKNKDMLSERGVDFLKHLTVGFFKEGMDLGAIMSGRDLTSPLPREFCYFIVLSMLKMHCGVNKLLKPLID